MFIFLFYILLNVKLTFSTIVVQNSGLYDYKSDDIAMIFFLTVENTFDFQMPVSVENVECIEGDPYSETANHMYLLGGDMGYIDRKGVKNLTLIYPNLYLRNRVGKCLVCLRFQNGDTAEEVRKEINFDSNKALVPEGDGHGQRDTTEMSDSGSIDCVAKYSSRRSYFNKEFKACQAVPECPPSAVYLPRSNVCRKVHEPVCKSDLEMIENGNIEKCHSVSNLVNYFCHHGTPNNKTGECSCDEGWTTSTCTEAAYHPTLNLYHMCNLEINSWERANREKLIMTILVLVLLAMALAAKMLLAVCLLNWCCGFIRSKKKSDPDDEYCEDDICPYSNYCGDAVCEAGNELDENKSSRTIRVSFSNIDAVSTADETDATTSGGGSKTDTGDSDKSRGRVINLNLCQCK